MAAVLDTSCKIRAPGTAMLFVWVRNERDFHLKSHRKIMGRYKKANSIPHQNYSRNQIRPKHSFALKERWAILEKIHCL